MLRIKWWKLLGVILLVYTFLAGMLVPLGPGILSVTPTNASIQERVILKVETYNTVFENQDELRAWLRIPPEYAISSRTLRVEGPNRVEIEFDIPPFLPVEDQIVPATLVIDDPENGFFLMPRAVFISQKDTNEVLGKALWDSAIINVHRKAGITFPYRNILVESIRNTYFHVALWFAMMILFVLSLIHSVRYLRSRMIESDLRAQAFAEVGLLFGILGICTGAVWAKYTWGAFWSWDVKQNMAAIALLIYMAYFVLRGSFQDIDKRARLAAVYNIFAFSTLIPLLYIIPRLTDSLHPGSGGNPALGGEDLDNTMRMVFYPAIIGWALLGSWMAQLRSRILSLFDRSYS